MASFGQTFDASSVAPSSNYDVLPPGKYLGQIVASEMRPTKDGTGQYLYLEVDILEGQYAGRKLFDRLNLINANPDAVQIAQRTLAGDAQAERMYLGPRRAILDEYVKTLDRLKLDGYVYPAIQMPPPDETMPQDGGISGGPHSATSWINMIGTPAIVVPAGFTPQGLPTGITFQGRPYDDARMVQLAYAYEQATKHRRPPKATP